MMRVCLVLFLLYPASIVFGQDRNTAEPLVTDGIRLHDKGDLNGALAKYDQALAVDKDNLRALTEKALTLLALGQPDEAIVYCKKALDKHKGKPGLKSVYITYGNALLAKKESKKSIEIYDQGIKEFPDFYQLYYNKGVTQDAIQKYDDALLSYEISARINPKHPNSHNAIARIAELRYERVAAVMAFSRFVILEAKGERAKENAQAVLRLIAPRQSAVNSAVAAKTSNKKDKTKEDFSRVDLALDVNISPEQEKKDKARTAAEIFSDRVVLLTSSLIEEESLLKNDIDRGFFHEYYVPYFIQIKKRGFIPVFSNIVLSASGDELSLKWIAEHDAEVKKFTTWSNSFPWVRYKP